MTLKIGTRGSKLALAQAGLVKAALEKEHPGIDFELVVIRTSGDDLSAKGDTLGPGTTAVPGGWEEEAALKGLFTKDIEEALLDGRVNLAVHSAKDMETDLSGKFQIGAVLKREDPADALITRNGGGLKELPAGARIGASSLRRVAQMKRLRRDLEVAPIQGNVDTRLKKLDAGQYDALVLAVAGLKRLGLESRICERLDPAVFLPAPGQGTLVVEILDPDCGGEEIAWPLEDPVSRVELEAERALLRALGGSCRVPIGALARVAEKKVTLEAVVLSPDGLKAVRKGVAGPASAADRLGKELASHLRAAGADRLLYSSWGQRGQTPGGLTP